MSVRLLTLNIPRLGITVAVERVDRDKLSRQAHVLREELPRASYRHPAVISEMYQGLMPRR